MKPTDLYWCTRKITNISSIKLRNNLFMLRIAQLQLQPFQAWTQAPAKPSRIVVLQVNVPAKPNNVETERLTMMRHGDTCHWHHWDSMPLAYDSGCRRYKSPVCNNIRRELVEEERVGEKGWCALMCLGVTQLNPFGPMENLIWNRCCSTCCTYFSSWKCLPINKKDHSNNWSSRKHTRASKHASSVCA